jgi:hypothetical protein
MIRSHALKECNKVGDIDNIARQIGQFPIILSIAVRIVRSRSVMILEICSFYSASSIL